MSFLKSKSFEGKKILIIKLTQLLIFLPRSAVILLVEVLNSILIRYYLAGISEMSFKSYLILQAPLWKQ